jgi:ABC-type phosphate transport system substrate-binding protein
MADTLRHKASSVEGAETHVPNAATRDDSSTSDHDEEKRDVEDEQEDDQEDDQEEEVVVVSSPVTGSAGVVGLSRYEPAAEPSAKHAEDEKVAAAEESVKTNENEDTKDVKASNGDTEGGDQQANIGFPSGVPLALLTFGLCMAT